MQIQHGFEAEIQKLIASIKRKPYHKQVEIAKYLRLVYIAAIGEDIQWCKKIIAPFFDLTSGKFSKSTDIITLAKETLEAYQENQEKVD